MPCGRVVVALLLVVTGVVLAASGAQASTGSTDPVDDPNRPDPAPVDVIEASGYLDPIVVDSIDQALDRAERDGAEALVIQLNSPGALVSDERLAELADRIADSPVAVGIWVGPSSAKAVGGAGRLLGAAVATAMAPKTRLGDLGDPLPTERDLRLPGPDAELERRVVNESEARDLGVLKLFGDDQGAPVLNNFIAMLDGVEYRGRLLDTASEVPTDSGLTQIQTAPTRLFKLGILARVMHTAASPPVAYLFVVIGLYLLLFEFFTAGVGVAGAVGALFTVLGAYGVAALPTRWWALLALALSVVAFGIDVQTGVPRFWTGIGIVLFVVASLWLFEGIVLSWITLAVGIGGVLLAMLAGMPSMVRSRFATPTVGRDWMVGELALAAEPVDPDGVVELQGALWRARTNRATPIAAGQQVRVAAIEGVVLEVEPLAGAARDHRQRRSPDQH